MKGIIKNRSGWIEIVEAFVSILLVVGVLLFVIGKGYIGKKDISDEVYKIEVAILREIETNDTMRQDILNANPVPVKWEENNFPKSVYNKVIERTPNYLNCSARICNIDDLCSLEEEKEGDIYAQPVIISTTLEQEPLYRKLNLFCWMK
ncbi:hypothetical protein M0R19_02695 [Candidatus Pacearchaeota archaeon]|jgi:hypothetical protein|nr:hypothetical protein [Candidatus Pacearchaeota archaeon]